MDGGCGLGSIMCRDLGLDLRHMLERPVPARLQFARDQPIGWIDSIVLPEGAVGGVARRFEVAAEGSRRWPASFSAAVAAASFPVSRWLSRSIYKMTWPANGLSIRSNT
jgi:hypothetical protein